jgi:hypothetical protein
MFYSHKVNNGNDSDGEAANVPETKNYLRGHVQNNCKIIFIRTLTSSARDLVRTFQHRCHPKVPVTGRGAEPMIEEPGIGHNQSRQPYISHDDEEYACGSVGWPSVTLANVRIHWQPDANSREVEGSLLSRIQAIFRG